MKGDAGGSCCTSSLALSSAATWCQRLFATQTVPHYSRRLCDSLVTGRGTGRVEGARRGAPRQAAASPRRFWGSERPPSSQLRLPHPWHLPCPSSQPCQPSTGTTCAARAFVGVDFHAKKIFWSVGDADKLTKKINSIDSSHFFFLMQSVSSRSLCTAKPLRFCTRRCSAVVARPAMATTFHDLSAKARRQL